MPRWRAPAYSSDLGIEPAVRVLDVIPEMNELLCGRYNLHLCQSRYTLDMAG